MSTDAPVNLNKHRKAKARAEARAKADENAIKFGRTKAERLLRLRSQTKRVPCWMPRCWTSMSDLRPQKHSLTLRGHRTSVSLEPEFWAEFRRIADEKAIGFNALAAEIDVSRGADCTLASAIRLYVLRHLQGQLSAPQSMPRGPHAPSD